MNFSADRFKLTKAEVKALTTAAEIVAALKSVDSSLDTIAKVQERMDENGEIARN